MTKKSKTLYYMRAAWYSPNSCFNETLQERLQTSLETHETVSKRLIDMGGEEYFINAHMEGATLNGRKSQLGELIAYNRGASTEAFSSQLQNDIVDVEAVAPDDGKEFLKGRLFFLCYDNHLIISGDASIRDSRLRNYLSQWLHNLGLDNAIRLNISKVMQGDKVRMIDENGVKAINTKTNIYGAQLLELQNKENKTFLEKWLLSTFFEQSDIMELSKDENMLVNIEIKYDRKTTDIGASFLKHVADDIIDDTEDDNSEYEIVLGNKAGSIKSNQLTYKRSVAVDLTNGILTANSVWNEMGTYLQDLQRSGALEGVD